MLTNDIYMKRAKEKKWTNREPIKVSNRIIVTRVLVIERGNGLLDVHMEALEIEIETRLAEVYTKRSKSLFIWLWFVVA